MLHEKFFREFLGTSRRETAESMIYDNSSEKPQAVSFPSVLRKKLSILTKLL